MLRVEPLEARETPTALLPPPADPLGGVSPHPPATAAVLQGAVGVALGVLEVPLLAPPPGP